MEHFYQAIPGWFAAERIYRAAVQHFGDGARFVEIGAWKGKSAAFMAVEIENSGKRVEFVAVDHFRGSDEAPHREDPIVRAGRLRECFDANVARVAHRITVCAHDSPAAADFFRNGSLDFVFIDGSHDEASVAADLAVWLPKLKPAGVIAGDDIHLPGVYAAVAKQFGTKFWPLGRCWVVCPDRATEAAFLGFSGLMIATPCYGGLVTNAYLMSMLRSVVGLGARGIVNEVVTAPGDSLIARARNTLVAVFLQSRHSHLLFIDADIEWQPDAILRLLRADKDIICGAYPKKKLPETYAVNLKADAQGRVRSCPISGAVEILGAATGFLMIRRTVFEQLIAAHPELKYTGTASLTPAQEEFSYGLFDCMIVDGRYLSEDYGFCRRWAALGGEVWLDPNIRLNHHGSYAYQGDAATLFGEFQEAAPSVPLAAE